MLMMKVLLIKNKNDSTPVLTAIGLARVYYIAVVGMVFSVLYSSTFILLIVLSVTS
jgi:hypothetical protein